jgi:hypothetical protein
MRAYNARGFLSNQSDRMEDLEIGLKAHFDQIEIKLEGCVALFSARKSLSR